MQVEIWSDVVCPWCALGKHHYERALARFPHAAGVTTRFRSFQLDPNAPRELPEDLATNLANKYGTSRAEAEARQAELAARAAAEGLEFRFDIARPGNTMDAHRLLHLAAEHGVQAALKDRLLRAYLGEGEPIGDPETLARLAADAGLNSAAAEAVLGSDRYADAVAADQRQAGAYGISGVPFFVIDAKYGVSGAQPADALLQVLETAWADAA